MFIARVIDVVSPLSFSFVSVELASRASTSRGVYRRADCTTINLKVGRDEPGGSPTTMFVQDRYHCKHSRPGRGNRGR
jgi:hypothetical protein